VTGNSGAQVIDSMSPATEEGGYTLLIVSYFPNILPFIHVYQVFAPLEFNFFLFSPTFQTHLLHIAGCRTRCLKPNQEYAWVCFTFRCTLLLWRSPHLPTMCHCMCLCMGSLYHYVTWQAISIVLYFACAVCSVQS